MRAKYMTHLSKGVSSEKEQSYNINKVINVNLSWNDKKDKKKANFGEVWGKLPKDRSNATAILTGDGLVVVDIDTKDLKTIDKKLVKFLGEPTVETARGYHYYFNVKDSTKYTTRSNISDHVDIRSEGGLIFNSYWGDDKRMAYTQVGEVKDIPKKLEKYILGILEEKVGTGKRKKSKFNYNNTDKTKMKELLSHIKCYDDYDGWYQVGMALKAWDEVEGLKLWDEWSQQSEAYDGGTAHKWRSFSNEGDLGVGTLYHLAEKGGYVIPHEPVFKKREGRVSVQSAEYVLPEIQDQKEPYKFDTKLLPKDVQGFVLQGAVALDNSPSSMFGVGVMIMLGNAIGRRVGVRVKQNDTWTEYPNFWGALIAPPSFKKSPIIKAVSSPIKLAEGRAADRHKEEISKYEKEMNIYRLEKSIHDKAFKAGDTKVELPDQPKKPARKRHMVSDATIEAVGQIMVDNPNGILLLMDELSGFFSKLTAANRESDRSFWLEAYTHQTNHLVDRIGRGSFIIPNMIAGIFGSIQPDIIQKIVYDTKKGATGGDGLLQRFQLAVIETKSNYEFKDTGIVNKYREKYFNLFDKVLKRTPESHGAKVDIFKSFQKDVKDEDKAYYYRFSKEATKVFEKWSKDNHRNISKEEKHNPALAAHFGKYSGTFAKIALVLFYCDRVTGRTKENVIDAKYARKAIKWLKFLESHARVIYDIGDMEEKQEKTLKDKIIAKVEEVDLPIHLGTLSRSIRGAKKEDVAKALKGVAIVEGSKITRLL